MNLNECRRAFDHMNFKAQRESDYLTDQITIRQNMNELQINRIRLGHEAEYYKRLTNSSLMNIRPTGSDGAGIVHRTLSIGDESKINIGYVIAGFCLLAVLVLCIGL